LKEKIIFNLAINTYESQGKNTNLNLIDLKTFIITEKKLFNILEAQEQKLRIMIDFERFVDANIGLKFTL
jgi:hypothetical protein